MIKRILIALVIGSIAMASAQAKGHRSGGFGHSHKAPHMPK